MERPIIGFIGVGSVGETLARLLYQRGYSIGAIYNRTLEKAQHLVQIVTSKAVDDAQDVVSDCDLIILSVSDDAISPLAERLNSCVWQDKAIIHVSGVANSYRLKSLENLGAMVGSLHPVHPFSSVGASMQGLPGATFAIEYSNDVLREWLIGIIRSLDGQVLEISSDKKAQYHTALVIASNYLVTLYAMAEDLLAELSDDRHAIRHALNTLMSASMQNLIEVGTPSALTGPLVRTDVDTIQAHLDAISDNPPLYDTYVNLAKLSYPMLVERGIDIKAIENLLEREKPHAPDDT